MGIDDGGDGGVPAVTEVMCFLFEINMVAQVERGFEIEHI